MSDQAYSGERIELDFTPKGLVAQHIAAYRFFLDYVRNRSVLDIGCGTGYGAAMLAEFGLRVTAIDYSTHAIGLAARTYRDRTNLAFVRMDAQMLSFPPHSFDVVCCSQLIEHLEDQLQFLKSIRSLLQPKGVALIVTPNRHTSLYNPFHVRELDQIEFRQLCEAVFSQFELKGIAGSPRALRALEERRKWPQRILALDVLKLRDRLPRRFTLWAYGAAARALYRRQQTRGAEVEEQVTEEDYSLTTQDLDGCLDLFAICHP